MTLVNHLTRIVVLAVAILAVSCGGNTKQAEKVAKTFLQAYYVDLDFAKAQTLCSDVSKVAVSEQGEIVALNPYAKEEVPELAFKKLEFARNNPRTATYVYTVNRVERRLPLRKFDNTWLVDLQGGSVEMSGNTDRMELQSVTKGGFAASEASGPIVYKKRKKNNGL